MMKLLIMLMRTGKMKGNKIFIMIMALMILFIPGAFAVETAQVEAGLTPDSPFYFMDRLGESLSVAFTFNDEGKAVKHLEFAEERLSEMQITNKTDKIEDLQENFAKNLQKSEEKTKSKDFTDKIEQVRARNQEVLTELKDKLPEEAQKGIENAIAKSQGAHIYSEEEKVQNRIANQDMMMEKFLEEFNGKSFEVQIGDLEKTEKLDHYYYMIENKTYKESSEIIENPDYVIKIKDEQKAIDLYRKYAKGEVITYNEVTDVFDVPLRLQGKLVSIVGIGGLK